MSWLSRFLNQPSRPTTSNAAILFTNTLTGKKEVFSPQRAGLVSMYSCGPTVYNRAHIGNLRAYVFSDLIARTLTASGYHVRRVINITDVGHLTGENEGDADSGEDKMEKGARREGTSVRDIAERYTTLFMEDIALLNISTEDVLFPRATEYVKEQIDMIRALEVGDFTYATSDGIYFDTSRFPGYGKLGLKADHMRLEAAFASLEGRIKENKEKRHAADFALWKFSPKGEQRLQEWQSPWGPGFPGWHIECSAMVKAILGPTIDIHTGGMDHIPVHHNNEIAQSESLSHKPLARFWMHGAFLTIESEKISKSLGNSILVSEIVERGYHPLAYRYLLLQAHYRSPVNFSWESLAAANEALQRLWKLSRETKEAAKGREVPSDASRRMLALLRDDLATPQALALLWETIKDDDLDSEAVWGVIVTADSVLGLSLVLPPHATAPAPLPADILALAQERDAARLKQDFARSDELRIHIEERGYRVDDAPSGTIVTPRPR